MLIYGALQQLIELQSLRLDVERYDVSHSFLYRVTYVLTSYIGPPQPNCVRR